MTERFSVGKKKSPEAFPFVSPAVAFSGFERGELRCVSAALPAAPGCQKGSSGFGTGAVLSVEVFPWETEGEMSQENTKLFFL